MDILRPASRRQQEIVGLVRETGRVSVEDLVARFGVTPQTIRRDLNDLSEARLITRTHGGAVVASGVENLAYEARKLVAQSNKRRIGEAAATLVPDHSSIFINLGTTTEEVAQALLGHTGLLVITNNINVANTLYRNASISVVIAGGTIRPTDGGVVGQMAADTIRQFKVDLAIIGTSAIDEDGTLLDYDVREVQVSRAIIENARQVVLVTDQTKFSRRAPVRIARLDEIHTLVTDKLPSKMSELFQRLGIQIIETGGEIEEEQE
ncbi:MAG TPA: DeoR/GlpR family DNA-binding transcription regulator [Acidisoma sp.]|nr:DeoR/GlpR family DNA-binding transcription regulator [Acidisoma sp.]